MILDYKKVDNLTLMQINHAFIIKIASFHFKYLFYIEVFNKEVSKVMSLIASFF